MVYPDIVDDILCVNYMPIIPTIVNVVYSWT